MSVSISDEDPNTKGTQAKLKKRKRIETKIISPPKEANSPSHESPKRTTTIPRVTITSASGKSSTSSRRIESWRLGSQVYNYSDAEEYYGLIKNVEEKFKEDFPDSYVL